MSGKDILSLCSPLPLFPLLLVERTGNTLYLIWLQRWLALSPSYSMFQLYEFILYCNKSLIQA